MTKPMTMRPIIMTIRSRKERSFLRSKLSAAMIEARILAETEIRPKIETRASEESIFLRSASKYNARAISRAAPERMRVFFPRLV